MSGVAVTIPADVALQYRLFSLYNSPYRAHDQGRAVDLYPERGSAPSPVGGEVLDVRSVEAPSKPYAERQDHLILVDVETPAPLAGHVARILHVDPGVVPGREVSVGDDLGRTIRSGFFAPWVDDHLHVGFREPDANPYRAAGSIRVGVDVDLEALAWDGRGTVVERGETYVRLDRPEHPHPGRSFVGIETGRREGVLDGGLPHYDGGGLLATTTGDPGVDGRNGDAGPPDTGTSRGVDLLGERVGTATGRTVEWADRRVLVDGDPVHGLSLYLGRDRAGAKIVCPDREFEVGRPVTVELE